MKHPNNLFALMERDNISQADIARAWSVENGDANQRVHGKVRITQERAKILTKKFGWSASEIYGDSIGSIPIVGSIKSMGNICLVDSVKIVRNSPSPIGGYHMKFKEGALEEVPAEEWAGQDLAAFRLIDDSYPLYLPMGSLVLVQRTKLLSSGFESSCLNRHCVLKLRDGDILFRILKRGRGDEKYNLVSLNGAITEDVELEWVARMRGSIPAAVI